MAAVTPPKGSAAPVPSQVGSNVAQVRREAQAAVDKLEAGWTTDDERSAINAIHSLGARIDEWAINGQTRKLGAGGWDGWLAAGEIIRKSIRELAQESQWAPLSRVVEIASDPLDAPAKSVKRAAVAVAHAAGAVTAEVRSQAVTTGLVLLLPVGIALGVYLFLRRGAR